MNTYKYEFSYREPKNEAERLNRGDRLNMRTPEDFQGLHILIKDEPDFPDYEYCDYDPDNDKVIIIKSEKPASVFDPIIERVCKEKYSARRVN